MRKNILFGALIAFLIFGFCLPVLAQQGQQQNTQTQTQNQGEEQQIQTTTQTQTQNNDNGQQNQQNTQNQQQTQNQGEEQQIQTMTKAEIKEKAGKVTGDEHRSAVANFVQSLLNVAEREKGGIGEQVRIVAQEQNQVMEKVADQIEAIQKRNKIKTLLIGTDYKNTGALRSEMVQLRNRIQQLNQIMEQTQNEGDAAELQNQIQTMEQETINIEAFIKANESKFSLFGWLVKLFN